MVQPVRSIVARIILAACNMSQRNGGPVTVMRASFLLPSLQLILGSRHAVRRAEGLWILSFSCTGILALFFFLQRRFVFPVALGVTKLSGMGAESIFLGVMKHSAVSDLACMQQ